MGLFNFSKNAGNAIFGGKNPNAEDIKKLIIEWLGRQNNRIDNLEVAYDSGLATLCGNCDTVKTKEKAILVAGNIAGVERVNAFKLLAPQPAAPTQEATRAAAPEPAPQAKPTTTPAAPPSPPQTKPTTPTAPQLEATQPADSSVFYTIQKGDTLSKISKQFYGDANKYRYIVEENSGVIEDADKIYPGQTIRIPPLPANL